MNAGWIAIGLLLAAALVLIGASRFRRRQDIDLGSVSHHWIAEHRLRQGNDHHR